MADGSNPLRDAVNSVTQEDVAKKAAELGVSPPLNDTAAPATPPAEPPAEERGPLEALFEFLDGERPFSGVAPKLPSRDFSEVDDGLGKLGEKDTKQNLTLRSEVLPGEGSGGSAPAPNGFLGFIQEILAPKTQTSGNASGGGVKDPGSDPDLIGGPPTEAQIAFRAALRDALGVRPNTGGDVDPVEGETSTGGTPGGLAGAIAGSSNESLVGQPSGPDDQQPSGTGHTGGSHPDSGAIDPLEGSAFTGPALGGNPEDLDFGRAPLGLDAARRSSDEDSEDEADTTFQSKGGLLSSFRIDD